MTGDGWTSDGREPRPQGLDDRQVLRGHRVQASGLDRHRALEVAGQREVHVAARFPHEAAYAVSLAYRVRYAMQLNARSAMHLLELRTGWQGHPSYRRVCQEMHRQIAETAGHTALAAMMRHVDHSQPELERLESERRAEAKRTPPR